jgi:hypothetical protein
MKRSYYEGHAASTNKDTEGADLACPILVLAPHGQLWHCKAFENENLRLCGLHRGIRDVVCAYSRLEGRFGGGLAEISAACRTPNPTIC